jgi:protein-S-isoprenylcysteine O-methyltransferase Ste14
MMIDTIDRTSRKADPFTERRTEDPLKQTLARIGRSMFTNRLEIGLGVTAAAVPFVRPTIADKPAERRAKAIGLGLLFLGLGLRVWAAGFAGRHTRTSKIEAGKLATAGPYAHVRNPIYLGSVILGYGMVLLIGDRRLLLPCTLVFLMLYIGLIPAEEEFLRRKFQEEYKAYCLRVPRFLPRIGRRPADGAIKTPFDWRAGLGEWRLSLILAILLGVFRTIAALRSSKGAGPRFFAR